MQNRPVGKGWAAVRSRGVVIFLGAVLIPTQPATAAPSDEQALAERFAPVVRLVDQDHECGPGEPYQPSDVDAFLDNDGVALRGPWTQDDLIKVAPSAADLGAGRAEYHLDVPGNPLQPGCDYERWARTVTTGTQPTTYAHVATEDGYDDRLALQFWFYYPFNDYDNKHESDWEMIQLVFAATDPAEALEQAPIAVGFSQHEGVETSEWDDPKLEIVDGTHPVVHVAAGSHANFYDSALYLGRSASQGFSCDDTREPDHDVPPAVQVIPHDPDAAGAAFPWIGYEGRWGQREQPPPDQTRCGCSTTTRHPCSSPSSWSCSSRSTSSVAPPGDRPHHCTRLVDALAGRSSPPPDACTPHTGSTSSGSVSSSSRPRCW